MLWDTQRDLFKLFKWTVDGIAYLFGNSQKKRYIKAVPQYCRWHCKYIGECRNPAKNWKCYAGCIKIKLRDMGYEP